MRQPAFVQLKADNSNSFRTPTSLSGSDAIMNRSLFLGTYPGLTTDMMSHEISVISEFIKTFY